MRAQMVSESIRNILKPKNSEEISQAIRVVKYGSYRLSSFLRLSTVDDAKFIRAICKENHIDPTKMEIGKIKDPLAGIIDDLFIQRGYKDYVKTYEFLSNIQSGTEYDPLKSAYVPYYKEYVYEYSQKHNVIRCITTDYFIFPKNELKDILIDNILNK